MCVSKPVWCWFLGAALGAALIAPAAGYLLAVEPDDGDRAAVEPGHPRPGDAPRDLPMGRDVPAGRPQDGDRPGPRGPADLPGPDGERMRHLREAAVHLRAAGMHDLAERILHEGERMREGDGPPGMPGMMPHPEQPRGEGRPPQPEDRPRDEGFRPRGERRPDGPPPPPPPPPPPGAENVERMEREIGALREQMGDLRRQLEEMRRAIEQLKERADGDR